MHATDFFTSVPTYVINHIAGFCAPGVYNRTSEISKRTQSAFDRARTTLTIAVPLEYADFIKPKEKNVQVHILQNLLARFPNLHTLQFGGGFTAAYREIISPLVAFLKHNYPKQLTHIKLHLIQGNASNPLTLQDLTSLFSALVQPQTLSLTARPVWISRNIPQDLHLILSRINASQLRVLDLIGACCFQNDRAISQGIKLLTNLEVFSNPVCKISDIGLIQLAIHCKKLTVLVLNFFKITDQGLEKFSQRSLNLRKLCVIQPKSITHHGLCALAGNCTNLEALHFKGFFALNASVLTTLANSCLGFRYLSAYDDPKKSSSLTLADVEAFLAIVSSSFEYLGLDLGDKDKHILFKEFPHIQRPNTETFYKI